MSLLLTIITSKQVWQVGTFNASRPYYSLHVWTAHISLSKNNSPLPGPCMDGGHLYLHIKNLQSVASDKNSIKKLHMRRVGQK